MAELKGLPEGVEAVEVRIPNEGELVWIGGEVVSAGRIRCLTTACLIVRAAAGYRAAFDILANRYVFGRAPLRRFTAQFEITNDADEKAMRNYLARIPGLARIEEVKPSGDA